MALINCPECGNTISDKAKTCPHCGVEISDVKQGAPNNGGGGGKKKLWLILVPLILIGVGVAIWVPVYHHKKAEAEEQARLEQIRQDSIAAVEAELARLEQLRQDSIAKLESFRRLIPDVKLLLEDDHNWPVVIDTKLKDSGYTGSTKITIPADYEFTFVSAKKGNYKITDGDRSITFEFNADFQLEFGSLYSSITIVGDDESLENLYKEAKKYYENQSKEYIVKKKGNTIKITNTKYG